MKNAILLLVICLAGAVNTMAQIKDTQNTSKFIVRDSEIYTVAITTSSGESYRYVYTPDMVFSEGLLNYLSSAIGSYAGLLPAVADDENMVEYWEGDFAVTDATATDWTDISSVLANRDIFQSAVVSFQKTKSNVWMYSWITKDTYEEEWLYIDGVLELIVSGDVIRDDVTIHELEWFVAGGERKVLIEQFTSSACSPCATTNAWLNPLLENNADKVVVVKYPMYFPGIGDPYYTPEGGVRKDYYNAISVPQVFVDGSNANGELAIQEAIDAAYALPSSVGIAGTFTVDGNNINIVGDVTPYVSGSGYKLYVTVNEKKTSNNTGSNGETEFHHVMMKMLPDGSGEEITLSEGVPFPFDFTCDMSSTHVEDIGYLEVVVFVQEISTKAILNAAYLENSTLQTAVFTWDAVAGEKSFGPMVPLDMSFTVDWGDGSTTTETGTGKREEVAHTYASAGSYDVTVTGNTITSLDFMNKQLTAIDLSACPDLLYLYCELNELTSLDLSACTKLEYLFCFGNHLPLSDLYAASQKIATQNYKRLGAQLLNPQIVQAGDEIDYSSQYEFGGIYTDFLVEKEGDPAVLDTDYALTDGKITFITDGDYTVTMTNAAIVSHASYPAKMIATFRVEGIAGSYVCKIVDTGGSERFFTDFGDAIADVANGETIVLLDDIVYTDGIVIDGISITIDLDRQYTLEVSTTGTSLEIINSGEINLLGDVPGTAEFNLVSSNGTCVYVKTGGKAVVNNAEATSGYGVDAYGTGTTVEVRGNVTSNRSSIAADDGASVKINGDITSGYIGAAAYGEGATIDVGGSITAEYVGVWAEDGGFIIVNGNVTGSNTGNSANGVVAFGTGSKVIVEGDVAGENYGVYCGGAGDECTVTVNGTITATIYITVNDVEKTQNQGIPVSGYLEYTEGKSIVRVKDTSPFVAVTDITDVPETAIAGKSLELTATINPADATNQDIVWTVKDQGTTGASITGNTLNTMAAGTVVVTATIEDGSAEGEDYTQDFVIKVIKSGTTYISTTIVGEDIIAVYSGTIICENDQLSYRYDGEEATVSLNGGEYKPVNVGLVRDWSDIEDVADYYYPEMNVIRISVTLKLLEIIYDEPTYVETVVYRYVDGQLIIETVVEETIVSHEVYEEQSELTGTMPAPVYYNISIGTFKGGAVHTETYTSVEGETVTLTILPDEDYELSSIAVYRKEDVSTIIDLSGSEDTRTFTMPAFDVTVVAAFEYTGVTTGINNASQAKALKAWVQNGILHVGGLTEGKPWSVYNISGSLIYQNIAGSNEAEISLPARGMYIVTSEKVSVKVMN